MALIQAKFYLSAEMAQLWSDALMEHGALSVTLQAADDEEVFQLMPEDAPLWQSTRVDAFFEEDQNIAALVAVCQQVLKLDSPLAYVVEPVIDQDWVRITQKNFSAQCFGDDLWVCPSWDKAPEQAKTVVFLDPGLAFGTGTHPTTALCLEWLANHDCRHKQVVDYGCGSGILALGAAARGAEYVVATDHDNQALEATQNNAALNANLQNKISIVSCDEVPNKPVDIVLANILANPLITLKSTLIDLMKADGILVLSGIMASEQDKIKAAYDDVIEFKSIKEHDGWVVMVGCCR